MRFLGQGILRTNQKRTNEVTIGPGGTYVPMRMNEGREHERRQDLLVRKGPILNRFPTKGPFLLNWCIMAIKKKNQ